MNSKVAKKAAFAIIFAIIMLFATMFFYKNFSEYSGEFVVIENSQNKKIKFSVEIADSQDEWAKGLMFRDSLCAKCGMLFEMHEDVHNFWMKNTFIPLDIIFIDKYGVIKKIHKNAVPKSQSPLSSNVPVNAVLEINGGLSDKLSIKEGDRITYKYFSVK